MTDILISQILGNVLHYFDFELCKVVDAMLDANVGCFSCGRFGQGCFSLAIQAVDVLISYFFWPGTFWLNYFGYILNIMIFHMYKCYLIKHDF